jgi:hypothetical protein
MSLVRQLGDMLDKAFPIALLLTGGVASAEKAIESVIERSGPDCSAESFLAETVRSAVLQRKWRDELPPTVPPELRALSLLSPVARNCFVLCTLVGFDCGACSRILEVSVDDVETGESFEAISGRREDDCVDPRQAAL